MNSSTDHSSTPHLFLNAQFETPSAYDEATRTNTNQESGTSVTSTPTTVIERHCFDVSNCQEAVIGLGKSVEPIKPQPGDYTYSGMHDHGPLPLPKEGGPFAQLIGFVNAAKKASDRYLTELIEREKMLAAAKKATGGVEGDGDTKQQKSKRKRGAAKS